MSWTDYFANLLKQVRRLLPPVIDHAWLPLIDEKSRLPV